MKKRVPSQSKRKAKTIRSKSVRNLKFHTRPDADAALDIVETYEGVERIYRVAVMAGKRNGIADSTNY